MPDEFNKRVGPGDVLLFQSKNFASKVQRALTNSIYGTRPSHRPRRAAAEGRRRRGPAARSHRDRRRGSLPLELLPREELAPALLQVASGQQARLPAA